MKILFFFFALLELNTLNASIVGVMDSGVDITHKDLASKAWINLKEKVGSVDLDHDGLPGDVNGWDFTENSPKVFNNTYNYLIMDADVKTFFDYFSKYELGLLSETSPEKIWLRAHNEDEVLMNKVNFVGAYVHGTHVAGISANNNSAAKILSMKIIPTVYQGIDKAINKGIYGIPDMTVEDFTATFIIPHAIDQITQLLPVHQFVNFHKIDVVNQSFGISYISAASFISTNFSVQVGRKPTEAELKSALETYFGQLNKDGQKIFEAAPNTLFAIAAGNDSSDNDLFPDFPASVPAENKIVVAATFSYKMLAEFSNFGATNVDVAAPGVAITSTAPANTYITMSGTSMATPFVTNIIAAIKDVNPALNLRDLKAIILGTVDVKPWLKDKVKTSGIVNKARALKAAEFAKNQSIDVAISQARTAVLDAAVEKSLAFSQKKFDLNFKPQRPSLLIPVRGK